MPRRRTRQTLIDPASRRRAKNERLSRREREEKMAARTATGPRQPMLIPVTRLYAWIGWCLLLPACLVTARTLFDSVGASFSGDFWRTPAFWFFSMGFLMWLVWFLWLPRPVRLYVWGHEMAHALLVILCGGSVREFRVTENGGHILADRNNFVIALAPYVVPLYAAAGVIAFLIAGLWVDLSRVIELPWGGVLRPLYVLYWFLGLTWSFHVTFTVWMILRDQPDLRINGTAFSLMVIVLINLLVLAALLILAAPGLSPGDFLRRWLDCGWEAMRSIWMAVKTLGGTVGA
jgi:hypothetical protein